MSSIYFLIRYTPFWAIPIILISTELKRHYKNTYYHKFFTDIENTNLRVPQKYYPNKDFIQYHLDEIFAKRNG